MQADVSFTWWRERSRGDYEVTGADTYRVHPSPVDVIVKGREPRIRAKGVCPEQYKPLEESPDLYAQLSNVRTYDDAIKFIRTFGPLTAEGFPDQKGERVYEVLAQAGYIRSGNLHLGFVVASSMKARLVAAHNGIRLQVEPTNLLDALWLQYAQARIKGLANRCKQCNQLFATGPSAKRRRGAEFCSVKCKTKFHSLERSR